MPRSKRGMDTPRRRGGKFGWRRQVEGNPSHRAALCCVHHQVRRSQIIKRMPGTRCVALNRMPRCGTVDSQYSCFPASRSVKSTHHAHRTMTHTQREQTEWQSPLLLLLPPPLSLCARRAAITHPRTQLGKSSIADEIKMELEAGHFTT